MELTVSDRAIELLAVFASPPPSKPSWIKAWHSRWVDSTGPPHDTAGA